jgi:FG-GAP repeat protein
MTGRGHAALAVVSLGIAGLVIHAHAQATRQGDVQVRQLAYLKASNAEAGDHFGCGGVLDGHAGFGTALSGDGNTLVVGAPHEGSGARTVNGNQNDNSVDGAGAAYVFVRNGTNWVQQAYLKASNPSMNAEFGHAVAISADGSTIVVSAFWDPSKATGVNGDQNDQSIPQAGAAYVFTRRGTAWSQQAYLKASNTGEAGTADTFAEGDQFGFSVAISDDGNTVAIGAHSEDSNGVSGNQADNSMQLAGAVYVYNRTNTTWAQTAYLKATNPDAGDMFGYSVSLSADGRTIAIGAFDEDGSFARRRRRGLHLRQAGERILEPAGLYPRQQCRSRRFVRRPRRAERRCQHVARGVIGRRLPCNGCQSCRSLRQRSRGRHLHRSGVRVHPHWHEVVAAGVLQGIEHRRERLVRVAADAER